MNWLFYLSEANLYLIVFFVFYKILLQKETFYCLNRSFLILSSVLSFLLPLVTFSSLNPVQKGEMNVYYSGSTVEEKIFTLADGIAAFYVMTILIGLVRLLLKLAQIYRMIHLGTVEKIEKIHLVPSYQSLPFSFFNYLFISPDFEKPDTIIRHEKVHIKQWHSADILYFELLAIINWFNPFVYLMQLEIKAIHEFLADEQASKEEGALDEYALFLIRNSCGTNEKHLTNQMFNQSLLRKRIIMLSKKKSSPASRLKYGLAIMIIPVLVCASSMALTKSYGIDLARLGTPPQDTAKTKAEKDALQPKSSAKSNKDIPEPQVEQVKFPAPRKVAPVANVPANNKEPRKLSKKDIPEPKVEQVKFPAPRKVAPVANVPANNKEPRKLSKKDIPEPKVEQVKFPAPRKVGPVANVTGNNKEPRKLSKKDIPEPKVDQVKVPAPRKVASGDNIPVKKRQLQKRTSKKDIPEPKVKQVSVPLPPKEASKSSSPPAVAPEDKLVPPPPPPAEPSKD